MSTESDNSGITETAATDTAHGESIEGTSADVDPIGHKGFITHQDISHTSEGLGSHARGNIFPLLQIALDADLIPVFDNSGTYGNLGRDYSKLDVSRFLDFDRRYELSLLYAYCDILELNTWSDTLGSACGDCTVLSEIIHNYMGQRGENEKPLLVVLYGTIKYIDPVPSVHRWLSARSVAWKSELDEHVLRIAIHLRVPEVWCTARWKSDNDCSNVVEVLTALIDIDPRLLHVKIEMFTESSFPQELACLMTESCPNLTIRRGTTETVLDDIKEMACADIFIASCSHFSAFVGYLCTPACIIILANKEDGYFTQHMNLGCNVVTIDNVEFAEIVRSKVSSII